MSYQLAHKAIKRLVMDGDSFAYFKAKLSLPLFQTESERDLFVYTDAHVKKHHALPKQETIETQFPELKEVAAPEPLSYYIEKLENQFFYTLINQTNLDSQAILKANNDDIATAIAKHKAMLQTISQQQYRSRVLDFGADGPDLILKTYRNQIQSAHPSAMFGWKALDDVGGLAPGEVGSMVGRMAMGKTFFVLHSALHNWHLGLNVLLVSMEMAPLPIAQRAGAMYAHTSLTQLKTRVLAKHVKVAGSSVTAWERFTGAMVQMSQEQAKFYVVDGNLAASVEDIYELAVQMKIDVVVIDGAYLTRHPTIRHRFDRIAENAELIKRYSGELELPTIASWQFNREAAKKQKGKFKQQGEKVGLEDVGGSDVIPQISGIVLGLFEEDGVETIQSRVIDIMKGRDGQVGKFRVRWDFNTMDFSQIDIDVNPSTELSYL